MALSSSIPNSILKPGVCTSVTRPSNPYIGQFIYETDTKALLVWSGTAWSIPSGPNSDPGVNDTNAFTRKSYVDTKAQWAYDRGSTGVDDAATAKTAADNANTNANGRLSKSGGTMTGNIFMGGSAVYLKPNAGSHALYFDANLNCSVLIGTSVIIQADGSNFGFYGGGAAYAGAWISQSSIRYKTKVKNLDSDSIGQAIDGLRPIQYVDKRYDQKNIQIGLIAEEVEEVIPEIVGKDDDGNPNGIDYARLAVLAISEIQQLRNRINILEDKIDELVKSGK